MAAEIKTVISEHWNKRAATFDRSPRHGIHSLEEKSAWEDLFRQLLGTRKRKILDVGTGTGVMAMLLALMGHSVTGVDLAPEMIEQARQKARKLKCPAQFLTGDAENLPFPDGAFHAVVNRHLVWTLPHPERAMAEWHRVLTAGGSLIVIDGDWSRPGSLWGKMRENLAVWLRCQNRSSLSIYQQLHIDGCLPMLKRKRPQADIDILQKLNFDVQIYPLKIPARESLIGKIKYGAGERERFVIHAMKS